MENFVSWNELDEPLDEDEIQVGDIDLVWLLIIGTEFLNQESYGNRYDFRNKMRKMRIQH